MFNYDLIIFLNITIFQINIFLVYSIYHNLATTDIVINLALFNLKK